jgi:FixJ family two-component response regulator
MISHSYHAASAQIRCRPVPEEGLARGRSAPLDFPERQGLLYPDATLGAPSNPVVASAPSSSSDAGGAPTVFVVDDDISVRESLADLIRISGWRIEVFGSALEFLERPHASVPSCVVLDLRLPDLSGLELQRRIVADRSEMPIIFLTGYSDVPIAVQAMKAGAIEFFMKPFDDEKLLTAIDRALEASRSRLDHEAELLALRRRHQSLSGREQEVMALVVTGLLNKQVGFELGISEITVKAHRGKVMRKMEANSLADLITMATRLGLPSPFRSNRLSA